MTQGKLRWALLLLALVALLVAPATASALNPVSFSPVGNMTAKRDGPGAAVLPDGRVLVAGGFGDGSYLDTAEIFDPKTNTFSAAGIGTMNSLRYGPAAAPLPDGRVLVAGGYNSAADVASAEVFDPKTGTFSAVGSMGTPRELANAAPLPDGRVIVVGGYSNGPTLDSTEIFDPRTNTFSPGPTLPEHAYGPAVVAISGGRVLVAGGYHNNPPTYLSSAFVFNPSNSSFGAIADLPTHTYAPAGAPLPGGRALLAGGYDDVPGEYLTRALIFDPATNSFSSAGIGSLGVGRQEAGAAALPDGRVLVAGGYNVTALDSAEILSVPSNAFKAKLKGRTVKFAVTDEGVAAVSDVSVKVATSAKKKPKLVKTTSRHGGPGTIVVKVKLTKLGNARLRQKGKLKIRVSYTPDGGIAATKKLKLIAGK